MLFVAILLLSPLPLFGNVLLQDSNPNAEVTAPPTSTAVPLSEVSAPSMPPPKANAHPSFADPGVPEPRPFPFQPVKSAVRHSYGNRNEKITWYSLMIAGHAGAALDAWSTRRALSGNFGHEADPLMRPFAHSRTLSLAP